MRSATDTTPSISNDVNHSDEEYESVGIEDIDEDIVG